MTEKKIDPFESIIFLTNRVGRLLSNHIRLRAKKEKIHLVSSHMGVLVDLWVKDGLRQQDLAVSAIKDKGTIARAIEQGFLKMLIFQSILLPLALLGMRISYYGYQIAINIRMNMVTKLQQNF